MKGYTEERGLSFKLDYDAESKRFVTMPVAHAFAPQAESNSFSQKLAELQERRRIKKARRELTVILTGMSPHIRDDIGVTAEFVAALQS
jgi:hypothetical protein